MKNILSLGNKQLLQVARLFLDDPSLKLSQRKVCKKTGLARMTVKKWLEFLVKESIISKREIGPTHIYSLEKESALVKQLKLLNTLIEVRPALTKIRKKFAIRIFIYGSAARGEDDKNSDLDVFVLGKVNKSKLMPAMKQLGKKTDKDVKVAVYSPKDWADAARSDSAFYERVEKDKVEVI